MVLEVLEVLDVLEVLEVELLDDVELVDEVELLELLEELLELLEVLLELDELLDDELLELVLVVAVDTGGVKQPGKTRTSSGITTLTSPVSGPLYLRIIPARPVPSKKVSSRA